VRLSLRDKTRAVRGGAKRKDTTENSRCRTLVPALDNAALADAELERAPLVALKCAACVVFQISVVCACACGTSTRNMKKTHNKRTRRESRLCAAYRRVELLAVRQRARVVHLHLLVRLGERLAVSRRHWCALCERVRVCDCVCVCAFVKAFGKRRASGRSHERFVEATTGAPEETSWPRTRWQLKRSGALGANVCRRSGVERPNADAGCESSSKGQVDDVVAISVRQRSASTQAQLLGERWIDWQFASIEARQSRVCCSVSDDCRTTVGRTRRVVARDASREVATWQSERTCFDLNSHLVCLRLRRRKSGVDCVCEIVEGSVTVLATNTSHYALFDLSNEHLNHTNA
jgi:hypothetical protein